MDDVKSSAKARADSISHPPTPKLGSGGHTPITLTADKSDHKKLKCVTPKSFQNGLEGNRSAASSVPNSARGQQSISKADIAQAFGGGSNAAALATAANSKGSQMKVDHSKKHNGKSLH